MIIKLQKNPINYIPELILKEEGGFHSNLHLLSINNNHSHTHIFAEMKYHCIQGLKNIKSTFLQNSVYYSSISGMIHNCQMLKLNE